ncbi:cell wall-associated NlpC family hydrolase [Streptomyces atratus]
MITPARFARYGVNKGRQKADSQIPYVTVSQHTFLEGTPEALIALVLMSHTAHIPSHRKPRRNASKTALRAGVAGGVLSTIAVAAAAGPAQAEPVTQTIEMPTLTTGLSTAVAASAEATQQVALDLETQAHEDAAAATAAKAAKTAKAEAVRKAEAKKKAEAAAKAKAEAALRASRSEARTTLSATSGSASVASSSSSATGSAASVISFVKAQVGDAYVSGGTGPNSWDCSGLVQAAFRSVGVDLPRVSQAQSTAGTQVSLSNLQPGDILYWGGAGSAYHVGVYVGGGQFVGAQNPSTGVVLRSLDYDPPSGAVRVL